MHNAPSVVFPVGRSVFYGRLLLFVGAMALLILLTWWLTVRLTPHAIGLGVGGSVLWLVWTVLCWRVWRRSPEGVLQWDARAVRLEQTKASGVWRWCPGAGQENGLPLLGVQVVLDLQKRALLRLQISDVKVQWIWVERACDPARWNDLRRALTWAGK